MLHSSVRNACFSYFSEEAKDVASYSASHLAGKQGKRPSFEPYMSYAQTAEAVSTAP